MDVQQLESIYERFCPDMLRDIMAEIRLAEVKHGRLVADPVRVSVILMEEVGEHAEAVLDLTRPNAPGTIAARREHAREELVQIAAVAMRAMEALDIEARNEHQQHN